MYVGRCASGRYREDRTWGRQLRLRSRERITYDGCVTVSSAIDIAFLASEKDSGILSSGVLVSNGRYGRRNEISSLYSRFGAMPSCSWGSRQHPILQQRGLVGRRAIMRST